MEITSVGVNYNNQAKSETVKQIDATEQQEVNNSKTNEVVTDTFTKSAAADAIGKQAENTQSKIPQNTVVLKENQKQSSNAELAATQTRPEKTGAPAKANTEETMTTTNVVSDEITETTEAAAAIVTSVSTYTAAEIAEYDINGDGEIDASEAAKMKVTQAKEVSSQEASPGVTQDELSVEQLEAKEAYEIAINQLLSTDDESVINEQI